MDLEELGYFLFMQEQEEKEKQIHNEKKDDLETEQTCYNGFSGE